MYTLIAIILCLICVLEADKIVKSRDLVQYSSSTRSALRKGILNIITRDKWGAKQSNGPLNNLTTYPPPYVVIHHSAMSRCTSRVTCQAMVSYIQEYHMNHNLWEDIGYNFLVGEDGNVYEGRGWSKWGAHAKTYNAKSIGICVMGDFSDQEPNSTAIDTLKNLISYGVRLGEIKRNYHVIGHQQTSDTICPGKKLYDLIKSWLEWQENPSR